MSSIGQANPQQVYPRQSHAQAIIDTLCHPRNGKINASLKIFARAFRGGAKIGTINKMCK
jgi:hypothetical protein